MDERENVGADESRRPHAGTQPSAAPGLLRLAASSWVRTAGWTLASSMRAAERLAQAAVSGESATELVDEARCALREQLRIVLGVADIEVAPSTSSNGASPAAGEGEPLRRLGAELLERSADVDLDEESHPAYELILDQLAPDEGRILRLLAIEGPQPAVDVRTWRPLGIGSELVAPGLSMIGARAGARHTERVPAYLNNLFRLGLIWFSREPISDRLVYQVLEAQPDVLEALARAGRASTRRRSIHLTPFGNDFCETCLPLHTAELDALGKPRVERDAAPPGSIVEPARAPAGERAREEAGGPPLR